MALPTSYLTSIKNLPGILTAIQTAKAPDKFTTRFLSALDYKSSSDRLAIGVLKAIGFLYDDGKPTQRYYDYLDQSQSARVLAEGIEEAYSDLFEVNKEAHKLSAADIKNKLRSLSQGQFSDSVLDKMASTFLALAKLADFKGMRKPAVGKGLPASQPDPSPSSPEPANPTTPPHASHVSLGGLKYNIELVLPESRDPAVYEALFTALKKHLL